MRDIENEKPSILSVKDAVAYVTRHGWQLSVKSMYRHMQQQKIGRPPWTTTELDVYAAEFLRPSERPTARVKKAVKKTAEELLEARKQKIQTEIETKQFELKLKRGEYIERSVHSRMFSAKALLLRDAVYNFIYEYYRDIIDACNGDQERFWEVIETFHNSFERYWQRCEIDFIPWDFVGEVDNYVSNDA